MSNQAAAQLRKGIVRVRFTTSEKGHWTGGRDSSDARCGQTIVAQTRCVSEVICRKVLSDLHHLVDWNGAMVCGGTLGAESVIVRVTSVNRTKVRLSCSAPFDIGIFPTLSPSGWLA